MVSDSQTADMKTDDNCNNAGNVWSTNSDLPPLAHDVNVCLAYNIDLNLRYFRSVYQLLAIIMFLQYYHIWNHLKRLFQIT